MTLAEQTQQLVSKLREGLPASPPNDEEEDSLIGIFQAFRPEGIPAFEELENYPGGIAFRARLQAVYDAVGCGKRSDNMKDAFFVVRRPPFLGAADAEEAAKAFVREIFQLAPLLLPDLNIEEPGVRILEGKAPKHPKNPAEKSALLHLVESQLPAAIDVLFSNGELGSVLAEAIYFIGLDRWLRDFLRWPLLAEETRTNLQMQSLDAYFGLWRHGIKFRIFQDHCIDFYLPHRDDGSLIQAGQFAGQ